MPFLGSSRMSRGNGSAAFALYQLIILDSNYFHKYFAFSFLSELNIISLSRIQEQCLQKCCKILNFYSTLLMPLTLYHFPFFPIQVPHSPCDYMATPSMVHRLTWPNHLAANILHIAYFFSSMHNCNLLSVKVESNIYIRVQHCDSIM